jgi:hypothetical protein
MGFADLDFWAKEWPVIAGAQHLFIGAIIATIVLMVPIIWFVINWGYRRQIAVSEERLKLAAEKVELSDRAKDEVEKQFHAYKDEVAAGAAYDVLVERMAKLEAAIEELSIANNAVSSAITVAVRMSGATSMNASLSSSPLPLRQAEADKERLK